MTNDTQALANRRNALLSTGPKTAGGRSKSSKNALAHGLYAATVVPALGESPEALAELCTAVREVLRPDGVLQERLCDRVALLLLRLDRVTRFEAAVGYRDITLAAAAVPDPDTVTGAGVDLSLAPHPDAPPVFWLAYARARVAGWVPVREAFRTAADALRDEPVAGDMVPGRHVRWVVYDVGSALGWGRDETLVRWSTVVGALDGPVSGEQFRSAVRRLAAGAGRDPDKALCAVRERLIAKAGEYDGPIAEQEAGAERAVSELRVARDRAAAAAVYADAKAVDTVIRLEAHLTRQLGLTLDLLDRLRGGRSDGDRAGFTGLLRELTGGASLAVG